MRSDCQYLVSADGDTAVVHIVGHADYLNCEPLQKFLGFTTETTRYRSVILDFTRCASLDSTTLGLVARGALRMRQSAQRELVLANLRDGPRRAATQLGLAHLATLRDLPELGKNPPSLTDAPQPARAVSATTIRDAHEALLEIDPNNRERFEDVLSFISASRRLFSPHGAMRAEQV